MPETLPAKAPAGRTAIIQLLVLLAACVLAFLPEMRAILDAAARDWEAAHLFAAPVLIMVLLYQRRHELTRQLSRPSVWGLLVIILSLAVWLFSTWPFNYAYPRRLAMVPAVAGVVLAVGGWRVLKLCLPMLLILMIAIPTGSRYYAFLIIKPEQYTLEAVRGTLDSLPGVLVSLNGLDLSYLHGSDTGMIALGEPVRGASLLLSFLTIGVFVTFARIRPFWQIVVMAIAGAPVVLFCNYARLLILGLVTIYGRTEPLSFAPRVTAVVLSLVLAYGVSVLLLWVLGKIIIDETGFDGQPRAASPAHA